MPKASGGESRVSGKVVENAPLDFALFFERLAALSMLIRMQVLYSIATDEMFAAREFRAYSAAARLRAVAVVATAERLEVS